MNDENYVCFKPMSGICKISTNHYWKLKTVSYQTDIPLDVDRQSAAKIIEAFKDSQFVRATILTISEDFSGNRYNFTVKINDENVVIEQINFTIPLDLDI